MSISPTFYARLFRTNVLHEGFLCFQWRLNFLFAQEKLAQMRLWNVGEIESRRLNKLLKVFKIEPWLWKTAFRQQIVEKMKTHSNQNFCIPEGKREKSSIFFAILFILQCVPRIVALMKRKMRASKVKNVCWETLLLAKTQMHAGKWAWSLNYWWIFKKVVQTRQKKRIEKFCGSIFLFVNITIPDTHCRHLWYKWTNR